MKILFIVGFSILLVASAAFFQFLVEKVRDEIVRRDELDALREQLNKIERDGTDDESTN